MTTRVETVSGPCAGLTVSRLGDEASELHARSRLFCLNTIEAVYGIRYRRDWHGDLDSLLLSAHENHYSRGHRGGFWTLCDARGDLVATAGVRHLAWKPNIVALFPGRYGRGEEIGFLCRVYVREDRRGEGIGRWLAALCEAEAVQLGYGMMYLHASSDTAATLAFWRASGYRAFGMCETSTHFDKPFPGVCVQELSAKPS